MSMPDEITSMLQELLIDPTHDIEQLEEALKVMPQLKIEEKHYFSDGVYAREIFIPAGTILTGKVHKLANLNIVSKGKIIIATSEGTVLVEAPCTIVSPPGTKRAGYALEDTIWTTIHGTRETELEKIESLFVVDTQKEYLEFERLKTLEE